MIEFEITQVRVSAVDPARHLFNVNLTWQEKNVTTEPVGAERWAFLKFGGQFLRTHWQIECEPGACTGMLRSIEIHDFFWIAISADEGMATSCQPVQIFTSTYKIIGCTYDGKFLDVKWEKPAAPIEQGVICVDASSARHIELPIPDKILGMRIALPFETLHDHKALSLFAVGKRRGEVTGPESEHLQLPLKQATLCSAAWETESILKIVSRIPEECGTESEKFRLLLFTPEDDTPLFSSEPLPAGTHELSVPLTEQQRFRLRDKMIALTLSSEDSSVLYRRITSENCIPLARPEVECRFEGIAARLRWQNIPQASAYELRIDGSASSEKLYANGSELPDIRQHLESDIRIVPFYGSTTGPQSDRISLFRPGFYPEVTAEGKELWRLCHASYTERECEFVVGIQLFAQATAAITATSLSVRQDAAGVCSVQTGHAILTRQEFGEWIGKLFQAGLTPRGYYLLRDFVARNCMCAEVDRLFLSGGADTESPQFADLLPGTTLRVESSVYCDSADCRGYVATGGHDWKVTLSGSVHAEHLQFNSFLDKGPGFWEGGTISHRAAGVNSRAGAGIADLFQRSMRAPFIKIYYPGGFPDSSMPGTNLRSDNVLLLPAGSYEAGVLAQANPLSPGVTAFFFRGRSIPSLFITILIGHSPQLTALGTTLGELSREYGITDVAGRAKKNRLRVFRNAGAVSAPLEIRLDYCDNPDFIEKLILMPGDHIEFQ